MILKQTMIVIKAMAAVATIPVAILFFFGPSIFEIVFGAEWRQAGLFSSILSLNLLTQFVTNPVLRVLAVVSMDRLLLFIHAQFLMVIALAFTPAALWGLGPLETIYAFVAAVSVHRMLVIIYIIGILRGLVRRRLAVD